MCFLSLSLKAVYTKVRRTHKVRPGKTGVTTTASVQMAQPDDTSVEACKNYKPIFLTSGLVHSFHLNDSLSSVKHILSILFRFQVKELLELSQTPETGQNEVSV